MKVIIVARYYHLGELEIHMTSMCFFCSNGVIISSTVCSFFEKVNEILNSWEDSGNRRLPEGRERTDHTLGCPSQDTSHHQHDIIIFKLRDPDLNFDVPLLPGRGASEITQMSQILDHLRRFLKYTYISTHTCIYIYTHGSYVCCIHLYSVFYFKSILCHDLRTIYTSFRWYWIAAVNNSNSTIRERVDLLVGLPRPLTQLYGSRFFTSTGGNMTWKLWNMVFKGLAEPCATSRLFMILDDSKSRNVKTTSRNQRSSSHLQALVLDFVLSWPTHQMTVLLYGDCENWNELFFFCSCATCTSHVYYKSNWWFQIFFIFTPILIWRK